MSDFKNTSDWKIKDGTTLVYSREYDGEKYEGSSEKKPNRLNLQLAQLSVLDTVSWESERHRAPEQKAGFSTYVAVSAMGTLDNCRIHAITLDDNENETFTKLRVVIHPVALEKLQETAKVDTLSIIDDEDNKPADGWMKDEIGSIYYHSAGEDYNESQIFASVFLAEDEFNYLVRAIKGGGIRSARLELIADVFEFGYETMGAAISGHKYNYAILCKDEGKSAWGNPLGVGGETKARLQGVMLEWSPTLDSRTAGRRDEADDDDCLEPEMEPDGNEKLEPEMKPVEHDLEKVVARLAWDVQGIRGRMDTFYHGALLVVVYFVADQVSRWWGF